MYEISRPVSTRIFYCCTAESTISKKELIITVYLLIIFFTLEYLLLLRRVVFSYDSIFSLAGISSAFTKEFVNPVSRYCSKYIKTPSNEQWHNSLLQNILPNSSAYSELKMVICC